MNQSPHLQFKEAQAAAANNQFKEAIALYEEILHTIPVDTTNAADQDIRLTALREQGYLLILTGEPDKAFNRYKQYAAEAKSGDHAIQSQSRLGDMYRYLGQIPESLAAYEQALQMAKVQNNTYERARALGGISSVYQRQGRTDESLGAAHKSYSLYQQLGDVTGQISSLVRLGFVHHFVGQLDKTITMLTKGLALAREHNLQKDIALILNNLGECHLILYDIEQAIMYLQEALTLSQGLALQNLYSDNLRNLGLGLIQQGDIAPGIDYLYQALALSQETQHTDIEMQTLFSLALTEIEHGDMEKGKVYAETLQSLAQEKGTSGYEADALYALGLYEQKMGATAVAEQLWQQAIFRAHDSKRQRLLWQIHASLAQIVSNTELTKVHNRIAAEILEQIIYPLEDEKIKAVFRNAPPIKAILKTVN